MHLLHKSKTSYILKRREYIICYYSCGKARRLAIGVLDHDWCNDPEKFPILELLVISFSRHHGAVHHHASITLHAFVKSKIIFLQTLFHFARMVL
jgi:hypothetical protein